MISGYPESTERGDGPAIAYESWSGSFLSRETTLHQLSPYIGKLKSAIAAELIQGLTSPGDTVYDPFAGSGTVALEAWVCGRNCIANDLSPYAHLLLKAKLGRPPSPDAIFKKLERYQAQAVKILQAGDQPKDAPDWVSAFFHPRTLEEILIWSNILREKKEWFLLSCLLGILHHQRPGFLSYPASHAVPYLRTNKFPRGEFAHLYEYRPVFQRLENKVKRALKRLPELDLSLVRSVHSADSSRLYLRTPVQAIITSPPYMSRLSYARDNRLRLWFLGFEETDNLDQDLSPRFDKFMNVINRSLITWQKFLVIGGYCALVLGDEPLPRNQGRLPDAIRKLVLTNHRGLDLVDVRSDPIPFERRVRRHATGSKTEVILVFQKNGR